MSPNLAAPASSLINESKLNALLLELESRQNFTLAVMAAVVTSVVGAGIWAAVTVAIEMKIGWMAVGVGFLVGISVRTLGHGVRPIFGYLGAAFAFLGCALGNYLSIVGFIASAEGMGYMEVFRAIELTMIPGLMTSTFQSMDLLFYGIAIYEGYKFSFREITEAQIVGLGSGE